MKRKLIFNKFVVSIAIILLVVVLFVHNYPTYKEPRSVTVVPTVDYETTYAEPKDFYDDSCITEEKKFYYEHLYNTTEE